jgi:L-asparagine transporter-like permease
MFMITIGGIIGAGLFVGSSAAIAAAGPAVVISYAMTGVLVLLVMRMLGEMAVAHPEVRSFAEFARKGLGHWAGFSVGWLYWYFWAIVIPIEAIAGANILRDLGLALPTWQTGTLLMVLMTGVNLMSARSFGEFEFWFSSIKVSAIIAFILIAAAWAFGLTSPAGPTLSNLVAHGGFAPFGAIAVLAAVTTVIFSMMGAEIVTVAAAESVEPARAVARMTSSIIWRIMLFYVVSLTLIVAVVPWREIVPGESPFTHALDVIGVPLASTLMNFIILTAVLSCLNSAFYVCSRVLHVLAEKGDAPFWLVRLNARRVPARSVLLASVAGFAGVFAGILSPDGVFAFLVNASGGLIIFIYITIAVAQIRLRRAAQTPPVLAMWLFPWLSYAAIAAMTAVLVAMALTDALASQFWTSAGTVAVALVAYALHARRRARSGISLAEVYQSPDASA